MHVRLRGDLGLSAGRLLLASVEGGATVPSAADRMRDVAIAFEAAYSTAAGELIAAVNAAALAAEQGASPPAR